MAAARDKVEARHELGQFEKMQRAVRQQGAVTRAYCGKQ